jgi:hypothetical protein
MKQETVQSSPYLERNGTALSKFKMNHASVLEAGLNDTRGGVGADPWKSEFDLTCFFLVVGGVDGVDMCANDEDIELPDSSLSLIVSYSLCPFHIKQSSSRKLNDEELSRKMLDRADKGTSALCWSKRIVPAVPVGATRSSQPSGRADVWTT